MLDGDVRPTEVALKTSDQRVAEKKLMEFVKERERERAGLIAPRLEREAASRNLSEHVADYVADLAALNRAPRYIRLAESRFSRLCRECAWKMPADVTPNSFMLWRAKSGHLRAKTVNDYLDAANAFLNWMVKHGRLAGNPLRSVTRADIRGKQQRRRAFTDDEIDRLLAVATPDIRLLYLAAAYTGLRLGELQQVVWADVHLNHETPHMLVRASTTKNRKEAFQPIHPALVVELRRLNPNERAADKRVFRQHSHLSRRIRIDMQRAGIERFDSLGRKLDFHALRYTFATNLVLNGVPERTAQALMRHCDPRLTANLYTDATRLPTFAAVCALPWRHPSRSDSPDAVCESNPASHTDTQLDPQKVVSDGQKQAHSVTLTPSPDFLGKPRRKGFEQALTGFVTRSPKLGATGFEAGEEQPATPDNQGNGVTSTPPDTQLAPQLLGALDPVLAKLVTNWSAYPDGIRRAIEALANILGSVDPARS